MSLALSAPAGRIRASVPTAGSSLIASTEARAIHARTAVEAIRRSIRRRDAVTAAWEDMLASRWREEPFAVSETPALQVAWALVSMRIVGRSTGALTPKATIRDAEAWFLGSIRPPNVLCDFVEEPAACEAVKALENIPYDEDLRDLLPYVLDAQGPGSRASVMRDPGTGVARRAKRAAGIFYTPSDVAEYIVAETLGDLGEGIDQLHILDPACGSGVFLKAALSYARQQMPGLDPFAFIERSLFGMDINPLAAEAACFVLLHECLRDADRSLGASPWSMWHRIRCNICVADALTFHAGTPREDHSEALCLMRTRLEDSFVHPSLVRIGTEAASGLFSGGVALASVFPTLAAGADAVIGNPPYAAIGSRDDSAALEQRFASLAAGNVARSDYFPLFIEMMWQLARPDRSSSGMVVPLSLAYSRRAQMTAIRRAIMASGGRWRFAFFDRQPHALFGEDVKTRNTIVFRSANDDPKLAIETGPLRKWTSRQRTRLFSTISFTPLELTIVPGIPKLAGASAAAVFARLRRAPSRLGESCLSVSSCLPEETTADPHAPRVFVAGTAYNFLNVFRPHLSLPAQRARWSGSKLTALAFASEAEAACAFALLSSRLAYWLWHVIEDGFHVTRSFVISLPFGSELFDAAQQGALATLGADLWNDVQAQQIISVNGGRQTVAYRPHSSEELRDEIDRLLLGALDVAPQFRDYLRVFARTVVTVDEDDDTRLRFTSHLNREGPRCPA
jgi:hypothetical protein